MHGTCLASFCSGMRHETAWNREAENAADDSDVRRLDRISRSLIGARLWRHGGDVSGLSCRTANLTAGRLLVMTALAKDTRLWGRVFAFDVFVGLVLKRASKYRNRFQ